MAKLMYNPINGGTAIEKYDDPTVDQKVDLEATRNDLMTLAGLADEIREDIARSGITLNLSGSSFPPFPGSVDETALEQFDAALASEYDRVRDVLDAFDYDKGPAPIGNVALNDLFLPIAVEDVSDEAVGNEAVFAIDAVGGGSPDPNDPLNTTYWLSSTPGLRIITFQIRDYPKKLEGIRLKTNSTDDRALLQDLTVKAAKVVGQLDANIVASGVNLDDSAGWFDIAFTKQNARFVRLECSESLFSTPDVLRIRSIQALVGITNHDK